MSHDVILKTRIRVLDAAALRASPRTQSWSAHHGLEIVIPAALLNPAQTSVQHFEVLASSAERAVVTADEYVLTTLVRVHSREVLRSMARACYVLNWSDRDWTPASLGEAAYEILLASNANPAPCDLGYEFIDTRYEDDVSYEATVPA